MSDLERLTETACTRLLIKAIESTEKVFSALSQPGKGSGACLLTRGGNFFSAGHTTFPNGYYAHAETLALMLAIQANPVDPVIAAATVSTCSPREYWRPCDPCLQNFSDYRGVIEKRYQLDISEIYFVCGKRDLSYELHPLSKLLKFPWKTPG
ncbi:MAG: hypothetical protein AABX04_05085 [Nanoarchaeota archaeon]